MERHLLVKRARVQGFLLFDYLDRLDEALVAAGIKATSQAGHCSTAITPGSQIAGCK